jgi:nucleotide-binding universal stress UspA family protein
MKRNDHHDWAIHDGNPAGSLSSHWNTEANTSVATSGSQWPRATVESRSEPKLPARRPSILVPVDGEQFSEHALPHALGIARRWGAEVRVVTVYFKSSPGLDRHYYDSNFDAFFRQRQRRYLDNLLSRLARVTSVPILPIFVQGLPVGVSLRNEVKGADLVVMATRGRGRLGRFLFGSVATTLVH